MVQAIGIGLLTMADQKVVYYRPTNGAIVNDLDRPTLNYLYPVFQGWSE